MSEIDIDMRECRASFDKAGYWPNETMWRAWQQAWSGALNSVKVADMKLRERQLQQRMAGIEQISD